MTKPSFIRHIGNVWDIKRYSLHDGPGIRTTVFFKGCPLRCLWCCNPESQSFEPEAAWIKERCLECNFCLKICPAKAVFVDEMGRRRVDKTRCDLCGLCARECPAEAMVIMGRRATVDEVLNEACRDALFFQRSGGGLTLSGGEPLAQPEFAAELLQRYKTQEGGRHTAIETCGFADWSSWLRVLRHTDLVLLDIKHMDPQTHFYLTGVSNRLILDNAAKVARFGTEMVIRLPVIPGHNDSLENIRRTAIFARDLKVVHRVDLLPYHRLGEPKYFRLERDYALSGLKTPQPDTLDLFRRVIEECGLEARIGG